MAPKATRQRKAALERAAAALGVGYQKIELEPRGDGAWRHKPASTWSTVEGAALAYFEDKGWSGFNGEGGLILCLIKAASFQKLPVRNCSTFIEALYAQNVAFSDDRFEVDWLVGNIRSASAQQIAANFSIMNASGTGTPDFFPTVTAPKMEALFSALGVDRLVQIATIFATAPYDLRSGWPDLTLWRGSEIGFREIKAPGDTLLPSQKRLIGTLLQPLGYDVQLVQVFPP
jgi:hypothetical protein